MIIKNKKARTHPILQLTIYIILNLIFLFGMWYFVYDAGARSFLFEQTYAKEIALIVDSAKPDSVVLLDVSEIVEIAKNRGIDVNKIFSSDNKENLIKVSLSKQGGYSFKHFTEANVELKLNQNMLSIIIKERVDNG